MKKTTRINLELHPDYYAVIDEVISNDYDKLIMAEAVKRAKNGSQAEAIYVLLKLQNAEPEPRLVIAL